MLRRAGYSVLGLLLLPAVAGLGRSFFGLLTVLQMDAERSGMLLRFMAGAGGWLIAFLLLGRPVRMYVLGHELSHLLAAWITGKRGGRLRVGRDGGSVEVSESSLWIALAPYLVPFYSLLLLTAHALAQLWWAPTRWVGALPVALGVTWSFHFSFTVYALARGQSDIRPYGALCAYPVILAGNLLLMCLGVMGVDSAPLSADVARLADDQILSYGRALDILVELARLTKNTLHTIFPG